MIGEEQPVVDIQHSGGDIEEQYRIFDTRFILASHSAYGKEDAPEQAHRHRQRYDKLVHHSVILIVPYRFILY